MNPYSQMMGVGMPYNQWRRHAHGFCAYAFPKRFGNRPVMQPVQPTTHIRPVYSRSVRPVVTSRPRILRPRAYPLRRLGAPADIQGLLGVGYPGLIAHGPDGHLYGWVSGYDGLGTPLGVWGKLNRLAKKGFKFAARKALPHVLPLVPGIGPAAATALKVARGAGLLGVAETGTPIYLGLDGYLYGVEGADYEPVHRFAAPMMHGLAADPIHGLEADYMHGLQYDHMHGLADDYVHGLADDYMHGLEDEYMHGLEDEYVHGLEDDYMHGLEDEYVHGLEDDYMHGLEDSPIHMIGGLEDDYMHGLEADDMDGLEDDHMHGLEADYMDGLEDDHIHGLETDFVDGLEGYIPNVMGYEPTRPSTTPRFNPTSGSNVFQPYL